MIGRVYHVFGSLARSSMLLAHHASFPVILLAQMRETSPFFGKSAMLNSIPKVKGVLLQSTTYTPK